MNRPAKYQAAKLSPATRPARDMLGLKPVTAMKPRIIVAALSIAKYFDRLANNRRARRTKIVKL